MIHNLYYLLFCLLLFFTTFSVHAQFGDKELLISNIPDERYEASVDLDQDGFKDIIVFRSDKSSDNQFLGGHYVKYNDGTGQFTREQLIKNDRKRWKNIIPADIDADGRLDLAVYIDNQVAWLRNEGNSRDFSWRFNIITDINFLPNRGINSLMFEDIDGDSDLDFLCRCSNSWYENNGQGEFTQSPTIDDKIGRVLFAADIGQNGTTDIVATKSEGVGLVGYEYQGGSFGSPLALVGDELFSFGSSEWAQTIDLDNDGGVDIIFYGAELARQGEIQIFKQQSAGYVLSYDGVIDGVASRANVVDYDNNGYLDIVIGVKYESATESYDEAGDDQIVWLKNQNGDLSFETIAEQQYALDVGKYNQDALADVISWKPQGISLLTQQGTGFNTQSLFEWTSTDVLSDLHTTELNGDGRTDFLFFSNNYNNVDRTEGAFSGAAAITVLLSGPAGYDIQLLNSTSVILPEALRFADIDNDDDQDVVALLYSINGEVFYGWEVIWYENDGNGVFGKRQMIGEGGSEDFDDNTFEVFDSDNDGYPEVAAFTGFYKNNQGVFQEGPSIPQPEAVADLDGDGAIDIIGENEWYENNGEGNFTARSEFSGSPVDFDDDGDIDVVDRDKWYENNGSGSFTLQSLTQLADVVEYVDVDGDGDADAVSDGNNALSWVENTDGKGDFQNSKNILNEGTYSFRFNDADGDGDQDLFTDSSNGLIKLENLSINESDTKLSLKLDKTDGLQQDTIKVPLKAESGFTNLTSLSFSLAWNTDVAIYAGVESTETLTLETGNTGNGQVGITWENSGGANKSEGSTFLSLLLVLEGEENSSAEVSFTNQPVAQAATNSGGKTVSLATQNTQFEIIESKAPTNISLDNNSVKENQPEVTLVGKFSTTDPDNSSGFTYTLVGGEGDDDNSTFSINERSLFTNQTLDFETKQLYSIRVQTTDSRGKAFTKIFQIKVDDVDDTNNNPTAIRLSSNVIDENSKAPAVVGTLTTEDIDEEDTHEFKLVDGEGDDDNNDFIIDGDQLLTQEVFDFETKSEYSVRIEAVDNRGGSYSQDLSITVNDVDESTNSTPTAIALDKREVEENLPANTIIGTFTTTDADTDDEHTYSLIEGEGDAGNGLFQIKSDQLQTIRSLDYEEQQEYSIRVQTDDGKGGIFAAQFTIEIIDQADNPNESPSDISLSNNLINENQPRGTLIGNLTTEDIDSEQFTYSLVDGSGSTHNQLFTISDGELRSTVSFDYETQSQFSLRIQTDDGQGGTFSKVLAVLISDVEDQPNRPPTNILLNRSTVEEGQAVGTRVGILSAIDPDNADQHQYQLLSSNDEAAFSIDDNELLSALVFDYNSQASYLIQVQSDDGRGGTHIRTFAISVTPTNNVTPLGVNNPVDDQQIVPDEEFNLVIPENVFQGDSLTLTVTQSDGSPLPNWITFDSATNTLNGAPSASDESITVKITATNPQGDTVSDEFVLTIEGVTSLSNEVSRQWKIYPVPTRDYLLIEAKTATVPLQSYRLINAQGKTVRVNQMNGTSATNVKIEVTALVEGIYLLEIQTHQGFYRKRILIE
ncbi:MAG: cadherin domain-containing protein [Bacteroidota bacterium]